MTWRRSPSVAFVVSGEQRVAILDVEAPRAEPVTLEGPAAILWGELDGVQTFSELVTRIAVHYGIETQGAKSAVERTLRELEDLKLVVRRHS